MVLAISRSWKKRSDLAIAQRQKNLPFHQLKLDIVTCWGSVYDMTERVLEQMKPLELFLGPTISAVKPLLNHLATEVLFDNKDDVKLTKEIKQWIWSVDTYASLDADVDYLLHTFLLKIEKKCWKIQKNRV